MNERATIRTRRPEKGIALLISIFVLLLISVVAIALIVSSGTESALAGNYRSSSGVYYAALAGLEEVRGRLKPKNPSYFGNTSPGFLPPPGTPLAVGSPVYMINPLGSETVAPWDSSSVYYDKQFNQEFLSSGFSVPSSPPWTYSVWNTSPLNGLSFPGPLYKWVRINAVSENSLGLDTYPYDSSIDATAVYYDGTHLTDINTGAQVLEITALAMLPNGSQKLVQYLVASTPLNLNFNAALTLDGKNMQPNVQFIVPNSSNFWVKGSDQYSAGSCNPGPGVVDAVGYTDPSDSTITSAIQTSPDRRGNYTGVVPTLDVVPVTVSGNLQTVAGLNALVQTITQNRDVLINGPVTQSDSNNVMPSGMSATNPMTVVVNGNLTINSWHGQGYGLLLVTGEFTFDPDATWNGIVLVIGLGKIYSHQSGNGQINGAVFLASTDPLGSPVFDFTSSSGSNGVYYSSCWIQAAMPAMPYKILSFHEISQ